MTTWKLGGTQSFLSKANILASSWMGTVSAASVQRLAEAIAAMSKCTSTKSKSSRNCISDGGFILGMRWTTYHWTTWSTVGTRCTLPGSKSEQRIMYHIARTYPFPDQDFIKMRSTLNTSHNLVGVTTVSAAS